MEIFETEIFKAWLKKLRDRVARARIIQRIDRIEVTDNLGDHKAVGDGVFELRIDYGAGYRVYFAREGNEIILLLIGGDKSSQKRDITKAKSILNDIRKGGNHG